MTTGERDALVDELSSRIAEEVLVGREATSPRQLHSSSHSFEPRPVTSTRPPPSDARREHSAPQRSRAGQQAPPLPSAQPGTQRAPGASSAVPASPPGPEQRRGFSRSLAALAALFVVVLGSWGALTALSAVDNGSSPTPGPIPNPGPDDGPDPDPPSVVGPTGRAQVQWIALGVTYTAVVETDGTSGVADVTFIDNQGIELTVREDLSFQEVDGGHAYIGSDPRDAITGGTVNYSPDIFHLEQTSTGWFFSEVCDVQGVCGPAQSTGL